MSWMSAQADDRGHNGIRDCIDMLGTDVSGRAYFI